MKNTKNYTVYFEMYGKKMKTNILADSVIDAHTKVKDKVIFHKTIVDNKDCLNKSVDILNNIMDIINGKK